ncbi:MAG: hypothetical protein KatS3mg113_1049 [Planctomycetaceae bacterium]|nr:MAG: hypothetical protein KatS3mg113_1049 [Planctomycetaceae bacterium]
MSSGISQLAPEHALTVFQRDSLSLADAVQAFSQVLGSEMATALLYTPQACLFARYSAEAGWTLPVARNEPWSLAYEARLFCPTAELRWRNDPSSLAKHQVVILIAHAPEQPVNPLDHWERLETPRIVKTLPQTYLLWGQGETENLQRNDGWSVLSTSRVGKLLVPVPQVASRQGVQLHTVEYIVEAVDGNAMIYDERLIQLVVCGLKDSQ